MNIVYMKKSLISNIIFKSSTWRNILFLFAFILIALAISKFMPFYMEGVQEGLLSSTSAGNVNTALDTYDKTVDTICEESVKAMSKIQFSQADSITFSAIIGDEALKNSAKVDKIVKLKSTNADVKKIITEINGKKYIATLTLLDTLNKESYTDDEAFTLLLKQQTSAVQDIISGSTSVYSQLKDYLKTVSVASQK
jgi:hypothetical protein